MSFYKIKVSVSGWMNRVCDDSAAVLEDKQIKKAGFQMTTVS